MTWPDAAALSRARDVHRLRAPRRRPDAAWPVPSDAGARAAAPRRSWRGLLVRPYSRGQRTAWSDHASSTSGLETEWGRGRGCAPARAVSSLGLLRVAKRRAWSARSAWVPPVRLGPEDRSAPARRGWSPPTGPRRARHGRTAGRSGAVARSAFAAGLAPSNSFSETNQMIRQPLQAAGSVGVEREHRLMLGRRRHAPQRHLRRARGARRLDHAARPRMARALRTRARRAPSPSYSLGSVPCLWASATPSST